MISKKLGQVFLRFVSIFFLMFEKRDEQGFKQKIGPGFFKICKYMFLIFEKGEKHKIGPGFFKTFKYIFFDI